MAYGLHPAVSASGEVIFHLILIILGLWLAFAFLRMVFWTVLWLAFCIVRVMLGAIGLTCQRRPTAPLPAERLNVIPFPATRRRGG